MVKASFKRPNIQPVKAIYKWGGPTAPYAPLVFYGYTSRTGLDMPGRDWVQVARMQVNLTSEFVKQFRTVQSLAIAFEAVTNLFNDELRAAIESDVYQWPRITRRRSGQIARSPRNIVDLGNLRNSQSMEIK